MSILVFTLVDLFKHKVWFRKYPHTFGIHTEHMYQIFVYPLIIILTSWLFFINKNLFIMTWQCLFLIYVWRLFSTYLLVIPGIPNTTYFGRSTQLLNHLTQCNKTQQFLHLRGHNSNWFTYVLHAYGAVYRAYLLIPKTEKFLQHFKNHITTKETLYSLQHYLVLKTEFDALKEEPLTIKKEGCFSTYDAADNPISLEWQNMPGESQNLTASIKKLSHFFATYYASIDSAFARKDTKNFVSQGVFTHLLHKNPDQTDWHVLEKEIKAAYIYYFSNDYTHEKNLWSIHSSIIAKDKKTGEILGTILCAQYPGNSFQHPEYVSTPYDVHIVLEGFPSSTQERGIEKLLMSSIFALHPLTKKICFSTRLISTKRRTIYTQCGFNKVNLGNEVRMEYRIDRSSILQKKADGFIAHK